MARKYKSMPFSCPPELIPEVDERAASLGLSRSAYMQMLIRADLMSRGQLCIEPEEKAEEKRKTNRSD